MPFRPGGSVEFPAHDGGAFFLVAQPDEVDGRVVGDLFDVLVAEEPAEYARAFVERDGAQAEGQAAFMPLWKAKRVSTKE